MVIGPTPPGTGVIAPAIWRASVNCDVADKAMAASLAAGTRLMPTSITVAPGLIQSPRTISGRPTAATSEIGAADDGGRSRLRECAIVTVQFAASSNCATGLPTIFERPMTTASRPFRLGCTDLRQDQAAERRARNEGGRADREPAGIDRMEAVDVLGRIDGLDDP